MSREEKLPPRALMHSVDYFRVKPVQIAPMVKDLPKPPRFHSPGWSFVPWTKEQFAYLNDFVQGQLRILGLDKSKDWIVLIGRPSSKGQVRRPTNGDVLSLIDDKTATKFKVSVKMAANAQFPYHGARTTILVIGVGALAATPSSTELPVAVKTVPV